MSIGNLKSSTFPRFSAYRSESQALVATTITVIPFDTEEYDVGSGFNTGSNARFTASIPGDYFFSGAIGVSSITPNRLFISLRKNGTEIKRGSDVNASTALSSTVSSPIRLAIGDYVDATYYCNTSGGSMAGQFATYISGHIIAEN